MIVSSLILLYFAIIFVVVVVGIGISTRLQFALWIKEIDRNKEQADTNELLTTHECNNDGYILIQGRCIV